MSTFGTFVETILRQYDKTDEWLAEQIGVSKSAISAWRNKANREPKPATAYAVAVVFEREFGIAHERTAEAAGYPFNFSKDENARSSRLNALAAASPRVARNFERIARLSPVEQDEIMSMFEAWEASRRRRRRKGRPGLK